MTSGKLGPPTPVQILFYLSPVDDGTNMPHWRQLGTKSIEQRRWEANTWKGSVPALVSRSWYWWTLVNQTFHLVCIIIFLKRGFLLQSCCVKHSNIEILQALNIQQIPSSFFINPAGVCCGHELLLLCNPRSVRHCLPADGTSVYTSAHYYSTVDIAVTLNTRCRQKT